MSQMDRRTMWKQYTPNKHNLRGYKYRKLFLNHHLIHTLCCSETCERSSTCYCEPPNNYFSGSTRLKLVQEDLLAPMSLHTYMCVLLRVFLLFLRTGTILYNSLSYWGKKWACALQNQQKDLCTQRRLRSVWASAQSDQGLRCVLNG